MHNTIALVAPQKGNGVTTTSMNLAAALAAHGETVLVEANLALPSIAHYLGVSFPFHLQGALAAMHPLQRATYTHPAGFSFIPASPTWQDAQPFGKMAYAIEKLKPFTPHVLLDVPPLGSQGFSHILSKADSAILIATPQTRKRLPSLVAHLRQQKKTILGTVMNKAVDKEETALASLPFSKQVPLAQAHQDILAHRHPKHPYSKEIRRLAYRLAEPNL